MMEDWTLNSLLFYEKNQQEITEKYIKIPIKCCVEVVLKWRSKYKK